MVVRRASTIQPKRVRWLWAPGDAGDGRIPLGKLTLIVGRGGIGKSTLLAEFTAWITRGTMRGEFYEQPRDVMYVANEDSLEDTVTPRRCRRPGWVATRASSRTGRTGRPTVPHALPVPDDQAAQPGIDNPPG
ncbi:AAA family ATPase [Streptomyces tanashiensis]